MSALTSGGAAADLELRRHRYDAFISFGGTDTRHNFVSHLYHALLDAGISTFKDDIELQSGDEIGPGIFGAIWSSKVSVVVLSRCSASSRWCLDELVEILRCSRTTGLLVIPVFYHIDPSDLRSQRGAFAKAFHRHDEMYSPLIVRRWRAALEAAGNLSGYVLDSAHSDEAVVVKRIVRRVSSTLDDKLCLPLPTFPVGLDSRVQEINSLISADTRAVRFVGILGVGGIGKTTLAKAIYNWFLHHFEAKCFLADVRANAKTSEDLVRLQEQLLHDVLRFKRHKREVHNVDQGISIIKERLRGQKALIILDDVSEAEQVRKLIGDCQLFGSGSIVIVTTRYRDVLDKIEVGSTYNVQGLNDGESLKLFSFIAFGECSPKEEFRDLSNKVIGYTKGVPLALELLGEALYNRRKEERIGTIQELKTIPNHDLQSKLRLSFDAFGNDDRTKKLFLDFVGYDKDHVTTILEACGLSPKRGTGVLTGRGMLEVDENNKLMMHDLLQDMGQEIVRGKSPDDSGKRSHLWLSEDVLSTMTSHLMAIDSTPTVVPASDAVTAVARGLSSALAIPLGGTGSMPAVVPMNHSEKPEKFNGLNFKRWQQKMFFYLTTLNLARFLTEEASKLPEGQSDVQAAQAVDAWNHSDFLCRNYILNGLHDSLYNMYCTLKTAKTLWDSLDHKYRTEDASTKKFVVGRFLDYKMVDSKTVISQVQDIQVILHEIHAEGMVLCETFQVAAIIEKLPPAWKDFKNYLKHKRKEMLLEDLIVRLRIEEDNRGSDKNIPAAGAAKANAVEHRQKSKKNKDKPKAKDKLKGRVTKSRSQEKCLNCGKKGHLYADCRLQKKKKPEANMVDAISQDVSDINLSAVVSEVNLVGSNPKEWWIDTGAT